MYDAIEMTKRNKMQNLAISFILLAFCFINLFLNLDNYKSLFTNDYKVVTNMKELNNSINKNLFIYVNMKKANLENYALKNDKKVDAYTLKLDNKNILVLLKEDTVLTSKVPVENIKSEDYINELKNKLGVEYEDKIILSNMNYVIDRQIYIYKVYVILGILFLSILSVLVNLVGYFNPTKTIIYKIYNKKYYY